MRRSQRCARVRASKKSIYPRILGLQGRRLRARCGNGAPQASINSDTPLTQCGGPLGKDSPPGSLRSHGGLGKPFLAPSTCPIDLFGPVANRTILKRLHAAFRVCLLVSYMPLARDEQLLLVAQRPVTRVQLRRVLRPEQLRAAQQKSPSAAAHGDLHHQFKCLKC